MFIERVPLRISLIGGGLDFPEIIANHDACTLAFTIDKYVHAIVNPLVPCFNYKFRVGYKEQDFGQVIDDIRHPIVREVLRFFEIDEYLDIQSLSNVPSIAGLGSSSAFTIALFRALNRFKKLNLRDDDILSNCIQIERFTNNCMGGLQDHYHTFYNGFNLINYQSNKVIQIDGSLTNQVINNSILVLDNSVPNIVSTSARGVGGSWYSEEELNFLLGINHEIKMAVLANKLTFKLLFETFEVSCKHKFNKMIHSNTFSSSPFTDWLIKNNIFSWKYCGAPGSRAIYILSNSKTTSMIKNKISSINSIFEIPINISN